MPNKDGSKSEKEILRDMEYRKPKTDPIETLKEVITSDLSKETDFERYQRGLGTPKRKWDRSK